jgi:hypothetical protein
MSFWFDMDSYLLGPDMRKGSTVMYTLFVMVEHYFKTDIVPGPSDPSGLVPYMS